MNDENEKIVLVFGKYYIYADTYQYILRNAPPKIGKDGRPRVADNPTYHRTISDCLQEIYSQETKNKVRGSKTLEMAITRLSELQTSFLKKLEPLNKLELNMPR